jgi:FkbM family methyltransferase
MKCAVIVPVGPGHEEAFGVCRNTIELAWAHGQGPFDGLEILPMWDLEGRYGRSARRNDGIDLAREKGCEWIFFLDADDLLNAPAFADFAKYHEHYDAVWGNICENIYGTLDASIRKGQLPETTRIEDILRYDPYLTLQMGHFVRTECAAAVKFDTEMNAGEDFKYYLGLWERFRCAKVQQIFFINRRGHHSSGPRGADADMWRNAVQRIIRDHCAARELVCDVMHDDKTAKFLIADPFDTIQAHHGHGKFFEIKELVALRSMLGRNKTIVEVGANVGNHLVFYAQHMNARKIFPFEPNPDAVRLLNRNIEMNGLEDLIDGRGIGIGAGAQYGRFAVELAHEHNLGAARLSDSAGGELEVRPLDEMLKGEKVDFMKIDVEGMEFDVLEGANELIAVNKPMLMVEVFNEKADRFRNWCAEHGYSVVTAFPCVNAINFVAMAA